jgi:hypothetical protein
MDLFLFEHTYSLIECPFVILALHSNQYMYIILVFMHSIDRSIDRNRFDGNGTYLFHVQSQTARFDALGRDSYKIKRNKNRVILLYCCWCLIECILNKRNCQNEEQILLKNMKKNERRRKSDIDEKSKRHSSFPGICIRSWCFDSILSICSRCYSWHHQ